MADSARGRIVWYELLTTDMKAAEKFYTAVVGWSTVPFEGSPQPYDMWMRDGQTPTGGVMTIPQGMNFPPHWEMYVAVDTIEDAVARIQKLGGSVLGPLIDVPNVGRMQTMMDPQKAVFAIYESATNEHMPDGPRQVGDASWHELMTTDAPAAMRFYSELFGWTQAREFDMGPMGKYHLFKAPSYEIGGMMNKPQELAHVPPHWGIYFRVPDINAATARVKENGGQVLNGPMEVPGEDWVVNCMDPQGAAFSLHQTKGA